MSWLAGAAPDAAVEITPEGVAVAALATRGGDAVIQAYAVEPLPPGAVLPSLTGHNVPEPGPVTAALRAACDKAAIAPRRVALIIPDPTARVSLVQFESVPSRRDEFVQLLHWQLKKTAPFPVEDAVVTYSPGAARGSGREFVVEVARRDVVREYEAVCESAGLHAGLVDLSTMSVANLFLGAGTAMAGDWLLVHMRPSYTSIALMRGYDLILFRTRAEGDEEPLEAVVHQTAMYYEDRLEGKGFARVLLGGIGRSAGSLDAARHGLEQRLGVRAEPIDPTRVAAPTDRIALTPGLTAALAPLVGILLRSGREAAA